MPSSGVSSRHCPLGKTTASGPRARRPGSSCSPPPPGLDLLIFLTVTARGLQNGHHQTRRCILSATLGHAPGLHTAAHTSSWDNVKSSNISEQVPRQQLGSMPHAFCLVDFTFPARQVLMCFFHRGSSGLDCEAVSSGSPCGTLESSDSRSGSAGTALFTLAQHQGPGPSCLQETWWLSLLAGLPGAFCCFSVTTPAPP